MALFQKINNKKGSLFLLTIPITLLVFLNFLISIIEIQKTYYELKFRQKTYLCIKSLNSLTQKYVKRIAAINQAISIAYGQNTLTHRSLIAAGKITHVSYLKNIFINTYCFSPLTTQFVKNIPYLTSPDLSLLRAIDGTTILNKTTWTINFISQPKKTHQKSLLIVARYFLTNKYASDLYIKTHEIIK